MQINYTTKQPRFTALHIANCGELSIYKVTNRSDLNFIKELPQKIKMQELMPNLTKDEYSRWEEMLQYAVDNAHNSGNTTYI